MILHRYKRLLLSFIFLIGLLSVSAKEKDYVLYLNSINMDEVWVKSFYLELQQQLSDQTELELKVFNLSVPMLKTQEEVTALQKSVLDTYPTPPKVVVVVGDPGWLVSAPIFDGPWKNIPVLLCYSRERVPSKIQTLLDKKPLTLENSIPIEEFNKKYNITVLRQPYFFTQTLQLIQRLQPQVKKIALISDNRYISIVTQQNLEEVIQKKFPKLTLESLSSENLQTEELLDTLSTYNSTTGVIYYSWFRQYGNQNTFYLSDHIKKVIPSFLSVPVYTLTDLNLKENLFAGGYYISVQDFTETSISIIQRVLNGEKASSIPYQDGGTPRIYLNYADLKWCNIPERLYPDDAVYYFEPPTFYQKYKIYIWMTGVFLVLLFSLYIAYYIHTQKNKRELIKAKEQAEESDRLKSAFLANMSHEIRTPLNAIVGFSSILSESADTPENQEYIRIIENNNNLLLQLINDILDLSRIEAGLMDFTYSNVDANRCLRELQEGFYLRMPTDVIFTTSLPLKRCVLCMEKNRVMQILGNYISNAIKYTTQGSITVGYYPPLNGKIRFFVRDTGCGIPANKQKDIFGRFVKLDTFKQGTGLGLSICHMIAEKMHATVGIDSELGQGSEFWLEISYQPLDVR